MQCSLIVLGLLIAVVGLAWPWVSKVPLGRLPGDIVINRPGFTFFFPVTTMIYHQRRDLADPDDLQ